MESFPIVYTKNNSLKPLQMVTPMDQDMKRGLKKIVKNAEIKIASSLLRWKYKKEGKVAPDDESIERQSGLIADQTRQIIAERGKNILGELKKAYHEVKGKGGPKT